MNEVLVSCTGCGKNYHSKNPADICPYCSTPRSQSCVTPLRPEFRIIRDHLQLTSPPDPSS